jgi:hypothetical protein
MLFNEPVDRLVMPPHLLPGGKARRSRVLTVFDGETWVIDDAQAELPCTLGKPDFLAKQETRPSHFASAADEPTAEAEDGTVDRIDVAHIARLGIGRLLRERTGRRSLRALVP